jgi:hypothetical protein
MGSRIARTSIFANVYRGLYECSRICNIPQWNTVYTQSYAVKQTKHGDNDFFF